MNGNLFNSLDDIPASPVACRAHPGGESLFPDIPPPSSLVDRERDADVLRRRAQRARGREVEIPDPADPQRRERLERDPEAWARHYLSAVFFKPFSSDQRKIFSTAFGVARSGGSRVILAPRGTGKSSILRAIQLMGVLSGRVRYSPIIQHSGGEATRSLRAQKMQLLTSAALLADYPEACVPARALLGVPQRANKMLHEGEMIFFEWRPDAVVLPTIRGQGGGIITATGIDGGGLRGVSHTTADGAVVRPDLVLADDLQTRESAKSPAQCRTIIELVLQDIFGQAGQGERFGFLGSMTCVWTDDVADQLSNPQLYPQFAGERQKMLYAYPERMDLWTEYQEIAQREFHDPGNDITSYHGIPACNAFYAAHRAEMDRGAVVCSEYLHLPRPGEEPLELSALQYAMNERIRYGVDGFESECQNNPVMTAVSPVLTITPYLVQTSLWGVARGVVPRGHCRICVGADVGKGHLHVVVGSFPRRERVLHVVDYYRVQIAAPEGDARAQDSEGYQLLDSAITEALTALRDRLELQPYQDEDGQPIPLTLACVDCGFMSATIQRFCEARPNRWLAVRGYSEEKRDPTPVQGKRIVGENLYAQRHDAWRDGRLVSAWKYYHNADAHKRQVHEGFRRDPGTAGAVSLFGGMAVEHDIYARQICAEVYQEDEQGRYRWHARQGQENHYLDATALVFACATRLALSGYFAGVDGADTPTAAHDTATPHDPAASGTPAGATPQAPLRGTDGASALPTAAVIRQPRRPRYGQAPGWN